MSSLYYVDDKPEQDQSLHVVASSTEDAMAIWRKHYERDDEEEPRAVFLVLRDVEAPEGPLGWHDHVKPVWEAHLNGAEA